MTDVDVADYETRIHMRPTTLEDYEALVEMQLLCFPNMKPWANDQIASQLAIFPEGQMCIEVDGKVAASCSTLIINTDDHEDWHNWSVVADNGYIRTHDPEGDAMYGIEIMVHPRYRGMRLARRLYNARKDLARQFNLETIIIGGRIPGYGPHADDMSAREYVEQVMDRKLFDPVLTTQIANGFVLKRLIPNYLPQDDESKGYATSLEWTNLDFVPDTPTRTQQVSRVRIGVVQYQFRPVADIKSFERQCEFFVDTAADQKCDFLAFPELFTSQLLAAFPNEPAPEAARRLAAYAGQFLEFFNRLAVKYNLNIVTGPQFILEQDDLYLESYLFGRDGGIQSQRRLHIAKDDYEWWGVQAGEGLNIMSTDFGKIAVLASYDVEFPELVRIAVHRGAQMIFVPFDASDRTAYLRVRYCSQARAIENPIYVITAGSVGNLPFVENADVHYAQSSIFTPSDISFARDGIAAECTPNIETVLIQDLDLQQLRRHRHNGTVTHWKDRRTDFYGIQVKSEDGIEVV